MPGRLPTFVIIGAAKAGTSALAYTVGEHPDAYLVPNKEVYFFDRDDIYANGVEWYRERFAGASSERAIGEASPSYLFFPAAPARMAALIPDAKLIAILRDPVARAYSQYGHERFYARERRSFSRAIDEELGEGPDAGPPFYYVERGRYLPQLLRVCEHYPRESLLVLLSDDLSAAPEETFARVFRFLGIDDTVRPTKVGEVINPYRENRFPPLWRFMMRHSLWHKLGPLREPITKAFIRTRVSAPPVDPAVERRLRELFVADNTELGAWLGRDLSAWNAEAPASRPV